MLPASASSHYRRLQNLQAVTVASARRAWRRMRPVGNWEQQYREDVGPKLTALVVAAQVAATRDADRYIADVLNELDFGPKTKAGVLVPTGLAGWAGDGRPVASLLQGAVVKAGQSYARAIDAPEAIPSQSARPRRAAAEQALADAETWIDMVAQTLIADATRAAEAAAIGPREWVDGFYRMLNPPSCSRCVILAGRFYRYNRGFERHERCDCKHIPAAEYMADDLRVDPDRYFESLSREQQDRIFTQAGAQAVRDGADITQVVNARRGMRTAQQNPRGWIPKGRMVREDVFGRGVFTTTEGITKTGTFGRINKERRKAGKAVLPVRLMPESIYEIAGDDRTEAIRLLKLYGFIL